MKQLKVAFHTLGCKVNQYETQRMKEQYINRGFQVVPEEDPADIYIINTCTVTNLADRKSRQYIRRMKKVAPNSIIAVTGCYAQVEPEELLEMPEVDIVTGNGEKDKLIDMCLEKLTTKSDAKVKKVLKYEELTEYRDCGIIFSMEGRTRAFIKIEEGCNRFCSYCLIPFARGTVRSRDPKEVVAEAKALIEKGFHELVLTGINTALYGTEIGFNEKYGISENLTGIEIIIREINAIPGDFRIRLSSLEPTVVNADYVAKLIKYEKLCHHLHLSIQSGSDKVIGLMNRHYTRNEYLDIVKVLRAADPGYGITTDIIVGFPGEEDRDFNDSLDMVEKVKFAKVHAFKYSKRKGTKAYGLKNQVSGEVKNERSDKLMEFSDKIAGEFNRSLIGTVRTALFEENSSESEKTISGYLDNYVKIYYDVKTGKNPEDYMNRLIKVKLLEEYKDGLKGEIVNE